MTTNTRNLHKLTALLLLVVALFLPGVQQKKALAASLPATPCTSAGPGLVTCNLWATAGNTTLPDSTVVPVWGFADSSAGVITQPGGPVLIVDEGATVTVNLTNALSENVALLFQGQDMIPDLTGVAPGGSKSYTFIANQPGTFLYEAGLLPNAEHQVAMGLYGALVVRSTTAGQAYDDPTTAFDSEALLVLSEIDPALNGSVVPADFDMRNYHARYFLINGKSYPQTDTIEVLPGEKVLLRMVNAGLQSHSMSLLGLQQGVIAVDGSPFNFARKYTADTIFTGQTSDAIVSMPNLSQVGIRQYAMFDANFIQSSNAGSGFGGMLTFLSMDTGAPQTTDTVGPVTDGITLSAYKVDGVTSVELSATVSDVQSGNSNIQAAEYFIDASGANGTGTPMSGAFASSSEVVQATIAAGLPTGNHTIYVHGQDAAGNWGAFGSVVLAVDQTGPAIIGAQLQPNPSNGTGVLLSASADDRSSGASLVDSAEYSLDNGANWIAMTFETSASTSYFTALLPDQSASQTVSVRATDEFGNTSAPVDLSLVVDLNGPVTSNVQAAPPVTNGIDQGVNSSIAAVRISASFSDDFARIATAEGFIDTVGQDGMGFPFTATDALFDSLSENGYVDIPLSVFWILPAGDHTVYVHARDAAGNWGAVVPVTVTVTH